MTIQSTAFGADLTVTRDRLAAASVERGFGVVPTRVGPGGVDLEMPLTSPGGRTDLGLLVALAVLCDCGIGTTVHSHRPDAGGVTLDLRVDVLEPPAAEATLLRSTGIALPRGPVHGTARVEIDDDTGRQVAIAVGALAVTAAFPLPVPGGFERSDAPDARAALDPEAVVRVFETAEPDGSGRLTLAVTPEMNNMRGLVHGGVLAAVGLLAQRHSDPEGRVLSFSAEYLRPAAIAAGRLALRTETIRSGRRFRTVRTTVELPDGRAAAIITGTTCASRQAVDERR